MAAIATRVRGTIRVPGDKSISHRALILGALARGRSRIRGLLQSADVRSTAGALAALGAAVPKLSDDFVLESEGAGVLRPPGRELDCGNSGTTARLLAGVVAGAGVDAILAGDASLSRRPMRRVAEPLRQMGATVELPPHGGLPMRVAAQGLRRIDWESRVPSAQVKSAILLAAALSGVRAKVSEPHLSRDHTERMLRARGVDVGGTGLTTEIAAGQTIAPGDVAVPADPSSAAYFVALALLAESGTLRLTDVCLNETRTGFFDALLRMGADLSIADQRVEGGEMIGTLTARPSRLLGIAVAGEDVPSMIDELPLLACVAACAEGETVVEGASELRVKESDRIAAVVADLRAVGADAEERADGFRVAGAAKRLAGRVATFGDHRMAMSFGILGAVRGSRIEIDDRECVAVSYPGFWSDVERAIG